MTIQKRHGNLARRTGRRARAGERRGNVLVLVAGILVLLVIIATSYLSRTGAERDISIVAQDRGLSDDRARVIAEELAQELAEKLFPRPIHPNALQMNAVQPFPWNTINTENPNRHVGNNFDPPLAIEPLAVRYSIDRDSDGDGLPDFWWNAAPYSVKPSTNWPDFFTDPITGLSPRTDDIPGNPGTNDFRLLADTEPARIKFPVLDPAVSEPGFDGSLASPDIVEWHTHWLKMSNPMRPGNGWMIINDISDIEGSIVVALNGFGDTGPYGTPFEQWLHHTPPGATAGQLLPANFDPVTGKNYFPLGGAAVFSAQWIDWFSNYELAYRGNAVNGIPANYYRLADCHNLFSANVALEIGERPQDEFAGPGVLTAFPDGAPRYHISRILADADGDGYTDSFWFLAPTSAESDLRTLVAMRVVDLSSMANVTTATQFVRGQPSLLMSTHGTRGLTPSDVALFEDVSEGQAGVGLFGVPEHWEDWFPDGVANNDPLGAWGATEVVFNPARWYDAVNGGFLNEAGPTLNPDLLDQPIERLDYWRRTGVHPMDPRAPFGVATERFTPFAMSDMLELMAYRGSNQPWNLSRLEQAISTNISGPNQLIRSTVGREEISEYLDQLDTRLMESTGVYFDELLHDMRRHLTTFNTARNETLPPWLWWGYRFDPGTGNWGWPTTFASQADLDFFIAQSRMKLDLRQLRQDRNDYLVTGTGFRTLPQRLVPTLLLALTDGEQFLAPPKSRFYYSSSNGAGGFDSIQADLEDTARASASFAANIISFQDQDDVFDNLTGLPGSDGIEDFDSMRVFEDPADDSTVGAVQVPTATGEGPYAAGSNERYMGLEAQPFILEAFIAHVYADAGIVPVGNVPVPYYREGENYVDLSSDQTTIVVVQIANPFERPIDLSHYKLRIYGQDVPLRGTLLPATEEAPRSAIFYSIETTFDGEPFKNEWRDYLDIETPPTGNNDLFGVVGSPGVPGLYDTLLLDADDVTLFAAPPVSKTMAAYTGTTTEAIELVRTVRDPIGNAPPLGGVDVVVDRIDNPNDPDQPDRYRDHVNDLTSSASIPLYSPPAAFNDPTLGIWDGVRIGADDVYVTWARAARVWRDDFVGNDRIIQDNERGPRFVFTSHHDGFQAGSEPDMPQTLYEGRDATTVYQGDSYDDTDDPDGTPGTTLPWFVRLAYEDPARITRGNFAVDPLLSRKPIFFTCYSVFDATVDPNGTYPIYLPPGDPLLPPLVAINLADKGVQDDDDYFYPHPLQILLKNDSFEQVGELLNVFLFGHLLDINDAGTPADQTDDTYLGTTVTFSEYMSNPLMVGDPDLYLDGVYARTNRLLTAPQIATRDESAGQTQRVLGQVVGVINGIFNTNSTSAFPSLPAGARVLSAFVCDGPGYNAFMVDANGNGTPPFVAGVLVDPEDLELQTFYNAAAFSGAGTPGMININTAPIEVFRALPHLYRLVHENNLDDGGFPIPHLDPFDAINYEFGAGRSRLPEAMMSYRERLGWVDPVTGFALDPWPFFGIRGFPANGTIPPLAPDPLNASRGDRGFESIGEIALLDRPGRFANLLNDPIIDQWNRSWRVDQAALNHLASTGGGAAQVDVNLSTDLQDRYDPVTNTFVYDETANDDEEANLLFAGLSNLVTTRSDSFVVYLRIRNVRQGSDGRWNALDPALLVDDLRYIMVVDRSNVDRPGDQPRILLFEELPK